MSSPDAAPNGRPCRACGETRLTQFLDLGRQPLAGSFLVDAATPDHEPFHETRIYVCGACGLIQHAEKIEEELLFKQYAYASSTVSPLINHFRDYARFLKDSLNAGLVVEFGCNDGVLLDQLAALGVASVGVDLSHNITEIARAKGHDVVTGAFTPETAEAIRARRGGADVVTGSNCFAHNDQPEPILDAARLALKDDGVLILEVIYAGDLHDKWQWDTLYHEHLATYSLGAMQALLRRCGWSLVDVVRLPMHAGALRVTASPRPGRPASAAVRALLAEEQATGLNDPARWEKFGDAVHRTIHIVGRTMRDLSAKGRIWGYGASGRATMWLNACGMDYLERIVDASPLRAGKLMPGTRTPIVLPDVLRAADPPPDYILITAWNWAEAIRASEPWYKGIWATPLPKFTLE